MSDAVIVDAIRTPLGRRNGRLAGVHPADPGPYARYRLMRAHVSSSASRDLCATVGQQRACRMPVSARSATRPPSRG